MKKILIALALIAVYAVTGGTARRTLPAKGVPAAGRDAASLAARITPIVKADSSAVPDEAALADLYDQTLAAYQAEMDELTLDQLFERFGKYAEGSEHGHIIVEELGSQFACKMADYEVMIASLAPDLPAEGSITFVEDERSAAAVAQSPIACALRPQGRPGRRSLCARPEDGRAVVCVPRTGACVLPVHIGRVS